MSSADSHSIGPDVGELRILTSREGIAASVGHDLVIRFGHWSGTVDLHSLEVTVDLRSLEVVSGSGGAMPLSARDRAEITRTALRLLDVERSPTAVFTSRSLQRTGDRGVVDGELALHGRSAPLRLDVTAVRSDWRATASLRQSTFGIKPYRGVLGALRVADEVRVVADVHRDAVDLDSIPATD